MPSSLRDRHRDPTDDSRNDNNNDNNTDSNIEHIIRTVLALALHKFDNGADATRESNRDSPLGAQPRDDRRPTDRGPGDNDLAKLVLGQVVQFGIRRYLKSREKKRATAAKAKSKANMRMPRFGLPVAQPGPPPGPLPTDRGLPERGRRESNLEGEPDQYYPPPQQQRPPYPPPPHHPRHRHRDDFDDRRYERRARYELRLERERLEQLERERLRRGDRPGRCAEGMPHQTRHHHQSPSDPAPHVERPRLRRVPRAPLPTSYPTSSYQEAREPWTDRDERREEQQQQPPPPPSQPPRDVARERRAYQRRHESFGATPRPFPADLLGSGQGQGGRYTRQPRQPPQLSSQREVDDDTVPGPQPPPPHPFSWESVPIYPPVPRDVKRDAPKESRRPAASRPADLPTPPISPQKTAATTDRQAVPADVHAHVRRALDDLLVQLRRTDSVVYRAMYRPPVVGDHHHRHHHHSHERGSFLFHAADLQRSIAQTKAEIRGLQGVLGIVSIREGPDRDRPEGRRERGREKGRERGETGTRDADDYASAR